MESTTCDATKWTSTHETSWWSKKPFYHLLLPKMIVLYQITTIRPESLRINWSNKEWWHTLILRLLQLLQQHHLLPKYGHFFTQPIPTKAILASLAWVINCRSTKKDKKSLQSTYKRFVLSLMLPMFLVHLSTTMNILSKFLVDLASSIENSLL